MSAVAIIAGAGPGTGAAIALRFAKSYKVALIARSETSYTSLVEEINRTGGTAVGIKADVSDQSSIDKAFENIKNKFPSEPVAAAIFNASGRFTRKPFLETTTQDYADQTNVTILGAVNFSRAALKSFLQRPNDKPHSQTLIFTGATASIKSSPQLSSFAAPKWALRALSQSLAKEFGPQGIHVGHAIIDGLIGRDAHQEKDSYGSSIDPNGIAEAYWNLHTQHKNAWTWEIDVRPFTEKW